MPRVRGVRSEQGGVRVRPEWQKVEKRSVRMDRGGNSDVRYNAGVTYVCGGREPYTPHAATYPTQHHTK